jgi:SAM-dependent methyltransferase
MTNIDLNQQVEIEFWRNAEGESPESNSLQNIINKLIDANTLVDCLERYRDQLSESGRILELGGGQCWGSCVYKRLYPKAHITGTDISPFAVQSLPKWERVLDVKLDNSYACKSYEIPEGDASLDQIFTFAAAHHFVAHRRTLAEFKRVLKPGGKAFYFFEPATPKYLHAAAKKRVNLKRPEVPEDVLIPSKIREIAEAMDLECRVDYFPTYKGRGATATAYYLVLGHLPFLQSMLPCTANFTFTKKK